MVVKFLTFSVRSIALNVPSSVLEFVLPHQMASLMRGGANAGPCKKDEL